MHDLVCRSFFHTPSQHGGVEVTFLSCALVSRGSDLCCPEREDCVS